MGSIWAEKQAILREEEEAKKKLEMKTVEPIPQMDTGSTTIFPDVVPETGNETMKF